MVDPATIAIIAQALPSIIKGAKGLFGGSDEEKENISRLLPGQEKTLGQLNKAAQQGKGGAFGQTADYYGGLLSNDSADYNAFAAPGLRQFNEEIIPDIAEQFAGMGAGGLSSSGFMNSATTAATDLSERLGALRAQLRMQGAQGLQNLGMQSLGNYSQNMTTQQGTPGLLEEAAPSFGKAITSKTSNWLQGDKGGNNVGQNSSPYESNDIAASPRWKLPEFNSNIGR